MSFFSKFSQKIEKQDWDHVKFIRTLLLIMGISVLFFYLWVLILNLNEIITPVFFVTSINLMLKGHVLGIIGGIIVGFFILLPYYYQKQWDLHNVIPNVLFFHLIIAIIVLLMNLLIIKLSQLFETAFLVGYLIGGMIAILAYAGEVKKEHQVD